MGRVLLFSSIKVMYIWFTRGLLCNKVINLWYISGLVCIEVMDLRTKSLLVSICWGTFAFLARVLQQSQQNIWPHAKVPCSFLFSKQIAHSIECLLWTGTLELHRKGQGTVRATMAIIKSWRLLYT